MAGEARIVNRMKGRAEGASIVEASIGIHGAHHVLGSPGCVGYSSGNSNTKLRDKYMQK